MTDLSGINQLEDQMRTKKIRWAVSVSARGLPLLRRRAGKILRANLDDNIELKWMRGETAT